MTAVARRPISGGATVINPPQRLGWLPWRELLGHRELLVSFFRRDLTLRYRQTLLGVVWVVGQPLLVATVLTIVFSRIAGLRSGSVPYLLVALSGMVVWTAASGTVTRVSPSLVLNAPLVTKIWFPRLVLPLSGAAGSIFDAAVALVALVVVSSLEGVAPRLSLLSAPLWILAAVVVVLGPALAACAGSVRFRDVAFIVPVALQVLFYISPVGYLVSAVPPSIDVLTRANPLVLPLNGLRWSVLGTPAPTLSQWLVWVSASAVMLLVGLIIFRRIEVRLADDI